MAHSLTRYDHDNIRHLLDGYRITATTQTPEQSFQRAKDELVMNLEQRLSQVKAYTVDDFKTKLK